MFNIMNILTHFILIPLYLFDTLSGVILPLQLQQLLQLLYFHEKSGYS